MKKFKKIMCVFLAVMCISTTVAVNVSAIEADAVPTNSISVPQGTEIHTRANVIVWKFRVKNGKVQKRRWNRTIGVWVDRYWMPV